MKKTSHETMAFTGIEAAIIFIAAVVAASVFSYVILGTVFFTSEQSQRVAHSGVEGAATNIRVVGDILGHSSDTTKGIDTLELDITLTPGSSPVVARESQVILVSSHGLERLVYTGAAAGPGQWNVSAVKNGGTTGVLSANQVWTLQVRPSLAIPPGDDFTVEIKPPGGTPVSVRRQAPLGIEPVNILY